MPNIEDCVNALHGAKYFSTIDLKSGYHQMGLSDDDKDKTAFITRSGQYRFERGTPFGLMGAPSSFQRLMSAVLADLQWESAIAYLDDVIVHGKTWSDHIHKLRTVCQRFQNHNLVLNPEKCQFGHQEVDVLGMHISSDGIRPNSEKISAIQLLPSPSSLKELRGALGSLSYFRRFIPNFADTAKPLYRLLEKQVDHRQFVWSSECETAFQQLKQCLWDRRIDSMLVPQTEGREKEQDDLEKDPDYTPHAQRKCDQQAEMVRRSMRKWEKIYQDVRRRIKNEQEKRARNRATSSKLFHPHVPGDRVRKRCHATVKGKLHKPIRSEIYIVRRKIGEVNYEIQRENDRQAAPEIIHHNQLVKVYKQILRYE